MNTKNIFIQIASILALVAVFYAGYSATAYITGTLTAADALGCGSCGTVINLDGGGGGVHCDRGGDLCGAEASAAAAPVGRGGCVHGAGVWGARRAIWIRAGCGGGSLQRRDV